MLRRLLHASALAASLSALALPAAAVNLAEYDVASANASVSDTIQLLTTATGVSASDLVAQGDLDPGFASPATFLYLNWPSGAAPDPAKFYEFSVTADLDRSIQYGSLSLAVGSGGGGTGIGAFQVSASLDGFTTPGLVVATRTFTKNATWQAFDLDLSALGTRGGTVTFRLYMYQVGNGAYSGLGTHLGFGNQGRNVVVNGTVLVGEPPPGCQSSATTLCIDDQPGDRRFQARVTFATSQGGMPSGAGRAIPLNTLGIPSGGIFWFTNSQNPEMLIKVLNGCAFNQHYWVFYAAGTNFGLETEVLDTITNQRWERSNPDLTQAAPVGDIVALPCGSTQAEASADRERAAIREPTTLADDMPPELGQIAPRAACVPSAFTLCIDDQPGDRRFEAKVSFATTQGSQPSGFGTAIPLSGLGVPSGGIFWFTNPQNPEMLLKVLNGCSFNGRYWVFYAAGTNFALDVEVVDTVGGGTWRSTNPDRRQAPPIGDISAFLCQ